VGNPHQTLIARNVSIVVVKIFEEVQIDQEQRERFARALRAIPFAVQGVVKSAPIGDLGNAVGHRQPFEAIERGTQRLLRLDVAALQQPSSFPRGMSKTSQTDCAKQILNAAAPPHTLRRGRSAR
jgi:hypothetical protein